MYAGRVIRLLFRFPFLVVQIAAGFLVAYGSFAMSSSAGLQPPNVLVIVGLVAAAASGVAAARVAGDPFAGWWPSLAALAVPWALVTFPALLRTPCPPDHPPITPTYDCVPPGAPIFFAVSAFAIALALWGAWRDLRRGHAMRRWRERRDALQPQ